MERGEKGLQVLRDHGVEHRLAGIPGCIGGNRWRHNSPHGQQGEDGSARNCPQLYCSFVQYTSKNLIRGWGRNTRYVSPCRGGGKRAFKIPIHHDACCNKSLKLPLAHLSCSCTT